MSCTIEVRSYARNAARHIHDFSQIVFPVRGLMRMDIEGAQAMVCGRTLAVVPPDHAHVFEAARDAKFLVIDVPHSEITGVATPDIIRQNRPGFVTVDPAVWRLLQFLSNEVENNRALASGFAAVAMTGLQLMQPATQEKPRTRQRPRLTAVAQSMVETDAFRQRSVAEWAGDAALSQSQFYALFRVMVGQSPKQFQIRRMLDRAVDRLINTSDPISAIALSLGYENVSSFNRIFKRHFGTTPSKFRQSGDAARPRSNSDPDSA